MNNCPEQFNCTGYLPEGKEPPNHHVRLNYKCKFWRDKACCHPVILVKEGDACPIKKGGVKWKK